MKLHTWLDDNRRTASWLAAKTGLSVSYVSRLASKGELERSPSMEACAKISEATGGQVTANDFMPEGPKKRQSSQEGTKEACEAA